MNDIGILGGNFYYSYKTSNVKIDSNFRFALLLFTKI
jgi:hypothetical protein